MSKLLNALAASLLFVILSSHFSISAKANEQDLKALIAFKNYISPGSLPTWDTNTTDYCDWDFITCSNSGRVTRITINDDSANIIGTIPPSVGDLSELQALDLSFQPGLIGSIPSAITKLKNLQSLYIGYTNNSGPIPPFLSEIPSLTTINLEYNELSGTIPYSLGNLPKLTYLSLTGGKLTGPIPPNLFSKSYKLSNVILLLINCKLTGKIPQTFGKIPFAELDLSGNNLVGDASFLFGKSKPADYLYLNNNQLSFDLTNVEYPNGLQAFGIAHNKIYGSISEQVTTIAKGMRNFDVSYNRLCGKIPSGGNFPLLQEYNFVHNKCLCGAPLHPCK